MDDNTPDSYGDEEAARRRDEALRRALNTPPQPKPSPNPKVVKPVASTSGKKRGPTVSGS